MFDRDKPLTRRGIASSKIACLGLCLALALLVVNSPSHATQSPAGCNTNGVSIDIQKSATSVSNGDTVTYTVTLDNGASPSCDAANIAIQGFCPDASGNPTSLAVTFPTIGSLPAPSATRTVGTFNCVINLGGGVTTAIAREQLTGVLHDNPNHDDVLSILKDVSVLVESTPTPPPPKPPNTIPTLSEWVMIMLAVLLVAVSAIELRKRGMV
jgi:hypothetical protein